ncbi:unnamed protein product [Camellia sinensis]
MGKLERAKMESDPKRRKLDHPTLSRRTASLQAIEKDTVATSMNSPTVQVAQSSNTHFRIQQAKNYAVAQARQEGCMANFRIFDSPFGNFLVPVIPTRAELGG